jgi:diguanylate cyclase (GGDEF)-like protein
MYLLPVSASAWLVGLFPSLGVSLVSAAVLQTADSLWRAQHGMPQSPWVGMTYLVHFTLVAFIVQRLRDHQERLAALNQGLQESLERERALARTDPLTGLLNSRAFREELEREYARSQRTSVPITVGCIDLDDFKRVNDLFGHAAGDELLQKVGLLLRQVIRQGDVAARVGGDELAIILHGIGAEEARVIGQRIIDGVARLTAVRFSPPLACSVGLVSPALDEQLPLEAVVHRADAAMYEAKARGKAEVVVDVGLHAHSARAS